MTHIELPSPSFATVEIIDFTSNATMANKDDGNSYRTPLRRTALSALRGRIDKSMLVLSEPRRVRDKDHLRYVDAQPCILCSRSPADAHHIHFAQPRALGAAAWQGAMDRLVGEVGAGRLADGLIAAIESTGAVLARHFPPRAGDHNELSNDLILL